MRYILAMRHNVAVAVTAGAPIFELAVPCEVFAIPRPELADPWYEFRLCAAGPGETTVAGGFRLRPHDSLEDLAAADTVVVPACADVHAAPPAQLVEAVRVAHQRGARVVALCSGAFVLAAAGLLEGRRATTHWMHAPELARRYPHVTVDASVLYVEDDNVFTSAGTAAGIDLCLELVRRDHGSAVANALARRLVVPPHRDGGQAQYIDVVVPIDGDDKHLGQLVEWVSRRLDQDLTLRDLASAARLSTRTLARRFHAAFGVTPLQWLLTQRVRRAQELLETSNETVDRVADITGLGTAANLRKHFARRYGVSPSAYRRTFQQNGHRYNACNACNAAAGEGHPNA